MLKNSHFDLHYSIKRNWNTLNFNRLQFRTLYYSSTAIAIPIRNRTCDLNRIQTATEIASKFCRWSFPFLWERVLWLMKAQPAATVASVVTKLKRNHCWACEWGWTVGRRICWISTLAHHMRHIRLTFEKVRLAVFTFWMLKFWMNCRERERVSESERHVFSMHCCY